MQDHVLPNDDPRVYADSLRRELGYLQQRLKGNPDDAGIKRRIGEEQRR
jgi:hypothetical protein